MTIGSRRGDIKESNRTVCNPFVTSCGYDIRLRLLAVLTCPYSAYLRLWLVKGMFLGRLAAESECSGPTLTRG